VATPCGKRAAALTPATIVVHDPRTRRSPSTAAAMVRGRVGSSDVRMKTTRALYHESISTSREKHYQVLARCWSGSTPDVVTAVQSDGAQTWLPEGRREFVRFFRFVL